jgi:toxin ParE1/3/4
MRAVVLLERAKADLIEIWHYTASVWDVAQADRYVGAIHANLGSVANGTVKPRDAEFVRAGLKRIRCGSHFAFVIFQEDSIQVVRVLHERMHFDDHF